MNAPREVVLRLDGAMGFVATTPSRHEVVIDLSVHGGGSDRGANPMELVLVALGSCMGMDVISILRKMRQEVTSYEIRLAGERAQEHPRLYTSIAMRHFVSGPGVAPGNVERAVTLSMTRYCPVHAMLRGSVDISSAYEVTDETTGSVTAGEVTPRDEV